MLTSRVVAVTIRMMDRFFNDPNLYRTITWRKFVSSDYNSTLGYNEDTYQNSTMKAVKLDNVRNMWPSGVPSGFDGSGLEAGEVVFFFKSNDLLLPVSIRDIIVDGLTSFRIKTTTPILGAIMQVNVQGI